MFILSRFPEVASFDLPLIAADSSDIQGDATTIVTRCRKTCAPIDNAAQYFHMINVHLAPNLRRGDLVGLQVTSNTGLYLP